MPPISSAKSSESLAHTRILNRTVLVLVVFLLIVCFAAAFRVPQLSLRPVHGDEANQAVKTGILYDTGVYEYDPHEHHGPTLYYFSLPLLRLSGAASCKEADIVHFRALTVLFGLLVLCLLWPLRDALGNTAMLWTALFMAVSHAMTYYSRYYVQEMLLICFVQAAFVAGWRYLKHPSFLWAAVFGAGLGLIHATKETSIIIAFAAGAAVALTFIFAWIRDGVPLRSLMRDVVTRRRVAHLAVAGLVALGVSITLFSSFFTHARGPLDSLLTYGGYFARAEGTGSSGMHDKPWHYYLQLLLYFHRQAGPRWSEAPVLLAGLVGIIAVLFARGRRQAPDAQDAAPAPHFRRFLVFYTLVALTVYTLIPYKTPWNLLVFYHGILLLAGMGVSAAVRAGRWRPVQVVIVLAALLATGMLARQNYYGNYVYYADTRNPYVYAHPGKALDRMIARIEDIAEISGDGLQMHVNIIRPDGDYWPLPWYLRAYERVGWWHQIPDRPDAAVILAAPELYEVLQARLGQEYLVEFHALRPGVLLHAYIRQDLWDAFMETRTRESSF